MAQVSLLLGAGFSVNKGYPTANDLAAKLTSLKVGDFCISPECFVCFLDNGQKDPFIYSSYFISKLFTIDFIKFYFDLTGGLFDYEKFYDFYQNILHGKLRSVEFEAFCDDFRKSRNTDESNKDLLSNHNKIFNQLVSAFIVDGEGEKFYNNPPAIFKPIYPGYTGILNCLEHWGQLGLVHIHSLNHDLFFESLNATEWINGELSDGFQELGSSYYGVNGEGHKVRLSYFNDNYDTAFRLYKLHGSFDQYPFHTQSGLDCYIKLKRGINKLDLYKEIMDKNGKLSYFNDWINYHSDFLTGTTSKILRYREPLYYDKVFRHFEENLENSEKLVIIGYGCGDSEINSIIENFYVKGNPIFIVEPYPNSVTDAFCKKINAKLITKTPEALTIQDFQ